MGSRSVAVIPAASPAARSISAEFARAGDLVHLIDDAPAGPVVVPPSAPTGSKVRVSRVPLGSADLAGVLGGMDCVVLVCAADDVQAALRESTAARRRNTVLRSQVVVTAAAAAGVGEVIVVTSAMVYGADETREHPLAAETPILATTDTGLVGDLVAVEQVVADAVRSYPGTRFRVVRPAALVGEGIDTVITRHFEAPRLLTLAGSRMEWQFCHVQDLATALIRVAGSQQDGSLAPPVVTVGAPGMLDQQRVEQISGMRHIELPPSLALATARRLHRVGVLPMPAEDLFYVTQPWWVAPEWLESVGWTAVFDNAMCLSVLLNEVLGHHAVAARRLERRDAALASAGAAVAVVSTAAAWRQARATGRRKR